ncbi:MAG TPA: glycosyltransferase family 9 protein [Actinomycetota bacterium]|nr:glycosyltransferase family 9 protein [Actinomycetota bacterium]
MSAAHVLVVRPDNDGDVLLAGPAIRAVANRASRVTLLCGPRGRRAAGMLPGIDEIVEHPLPWIDPEPKPATRAAVLELTGRIEALGADEAFIFTSFHQSPLPTALVLRMAGVAFVAAVSEDYPGSLLDLRHRVPDDIHEVERSLSLVGAAGYRLAPEDDGRLRISRSGKSPLAESFRPYVVLHPGASVPARAWDPARNAELARRLHELGYKVAVTGSAAERELTAFVAGAEGPGVQGPGVRDLGGLTNFADLAEVIAGAEAVVVGNTGPAHLAAAVGTPVISLYAPTVPAARWHPWRVPHVVLGDQEVPCAGCRARVCPIPGQPCLAAVTVDDVLNALEDITGGVRLQGATR